MSSSFLKRAAPFLLAVLLIGVAFAGGMYIGSERTAQAQAIAGLSNTTLGQPSNVDFGAFWQAWNILSEKYAPTTKHPSVPDQQKIYGAIKGLADAYGDPYTTFFPPVEQKQFQAEISGNFEGVGMEVATKNGILTVIAPLKNSPAAKAGIKPGDQIIKIEATSTADMSADTAVNFIRGKRGTTVTLTVIGPEEKTPHVVKIVRDVIDLPTIDTKLTPDGVFVISLYTFTADSANLFRNALQEFVRSKSNKLVLDLRGNPGGYLDAAVDMASWFLPSDAVIVKEDTGGHAEDMVYHSKGYNIFGKDLKMVILADGGSASASEILSGALQQHGIAKLVGTKTFGKGSVQELVPLNSETSLKITVARWLTPNGTSISDQGLTPDVLVPVTQKDIENKVDPQMQAAVNILLGK
jgi:carboxyl-terminal processing protease